ncbi:MAG: hypothetical protein A3H96_03385 [Acidobacteria bacterium RIFCSPLOWO2_02_FULL_67_36]|nr:MAG: hypothetical protein A3H96_03385 [Acidobacteria bacterium RIFCSPLOWO2_02_FULL_67_36]OFW22756.1 MAG: hypothetical protein A3G21_26070 [Acidobacteria bacterium RIFCSPLOWO2_12_FULL_66_21]
MTRRLTLVLLAVLGLSGGLRLIAEDVILVPGTISGSISLGGAVIKQATVYAYPSSGGPTSWINVVPNATSGTYSLTVNVPQSGAATFNAYAVVYTDEYRDYLQTTTSQVSVSATTPGQVNFNPAVGYINASVSVSGGTISTAYVFASQNGAYATTNARPQDGWMFPTMPGSSITVGGTAYLTDGRQVNLTNQTVSIAPGQTLDVSFSVTAPTNAIAGTIDFTGPRTVTAISAYASGPTYRSIYQSPPPANHAYLLDGLGTGQYTVGVYAYTNNNQAYLYLPNSAFSPSRTVQVGQTEVTVDVAAPQAFINSSLTLTGAPTLSPHLNWGQIQYSGQYQTAAEGGYSYAQMNLAARTFDSVVAPGSWRQSAVYLGFYRSTAPSLSASLYFYDNRPTSSIALAAGETKTPAIDLALGEVTITMSVAGGGTLSNPRLQSAYCSYTVDGTTLWSFYPYANTYVSNVTQGQVTFLGPAGTCSVFPSMTVNGSNVTLAPISVTIVPGTTQVIDVGGPTLTMTSPAAEAIVSMPSVTVSGKATDDVGVQTVTVNGAAVALILTGGADHEVQFGTTVSGLQRGPNTVTTVASDATAKNNTDTRTVYYDTAAPSLAFTPADGATTDATSITVAGTADDDAGVGKIAVNGVAVSFSSTNDAAKPKEVSFTTSVPLVIGSNPIVVTVTDISTRTTSASHTVARTQQAATSLSVLGSAVYGGTATYRATLTSNGTPVPGKSVHFTCDLGDADATTNANGVATATGISVAGANAGSFTLGASFAGDSSYAASSATGLLWVIKAPAQILLSRLTQTYTGSGISPVVATDPANLTGVSVTYEDGTHNLPVNAGTHHLVATLTNPNYVAPAVEADLVITKGTPAVSATGGTFIYDGQPHAGSATVTGAQGESLGPVTFTYGSGTSGLLVQFAAAVNYGVGNQPMGAPVVADFDGDGKFDLAVANHSDGTVSSLKGDGTGRFSPLATYTVGQYPSSIAAADFNGDGRLDLAVASGGYSNTTSILLGNGDGTFQNGPTATGGFAANQIRALDVNRDGKVDLLTVGYYHGAVLMLGNGDGTFQAPRALGPSNESTLGVAAGDLNGDGIIDIVVPASLTESNPPNDILAMFFGNADGTFQPAVSIPDSRGLEAVEIADLNHDARLDLITGSWAGLAVRLGHGDGTFGPPAYLPAGSATMWITVTDVNRDGAPDILATNNDRSVIVLIGRGDGTFEAAANYMAGSSTRGVSVTDLDGDGALDLVVTNLGSNNVSVLLQSPSGRGSPAPPVQAGSYVVTASYAGSTNYTAATASATLTIAKAALTVAAEDTTKTYGTGNPVFTATYSGFVSGEDPTALTGTLTFNTPATTSSPVGAYSVAPSGVTSLNYAIAFVDGSLSVTPVRLTVRANDATRRYGSANPEFGVAYAGFVLGEGPAQLQGGLQVTTAATDHSDTGTYDIVPSGLTAANYDVSFTNGTLSITPATAHVDVAPAGPFTYDAAPHGTTASVHGVFGEDLGAVTITYDGSSAAPIDAGTHAVLASFAGNANYLPAAGSGSILLDPAPLVVTANDASREFGTPNPTFTASYSGFAGGDSPSSLSGALEFWTPAVVSSPVGTYPVVPSGISSPNYTITFKAGALSIVDTTPPVIASVTPSTTSLWPANHKMVRVSFPVDATDAPGPPVCSISRIASSEPENGLGDGDTASDWTRTGALTADLRAERGGSGPGRTYSVTVTCRDASGNESSKIATVSVPHNK